MVADDSPNLRTTPGPSALKYSPPSAYTGHVREIIERTLTRAEAELARDLRGISIGGEIRPGLSSLNTPGASTSEMREAANRFLQSLTTEQREIAAFSMDDERSWRSWHNMHFNLLRHGLSMVDLSVEQRHRALEMVRVAMSDTGYANTRDVMRLNEHAAELTGRVEEYGEYYYWISMFGVPSASEPWGWQLDGHHVSVNCVVLRDQIVMTPDFRGSEPCEATTGGFAGTKVFAEEETAGLQLMRSLDASQRTAATISDEPPRELITTAQVDNFSLEADGLVFERLTPNQQSDCVDLIALYVDRIRPDHAELRLADIKKHLAETQFSWMGSSEDESPFYYRIANPVILIEFDHLPGIIYDNQEPTRRHVHTIVRTPNGNDYGRSLLFEHYRQHDHGDVGAHR